MNNQDKISWYLSKGFGGEVEWEKSGKAKLFDSDNLVILSRMKKENVIVGINIAVNQAIKLTPIPPKPMSFKVGEYDKVCRTAYALF